MESPLPRDNEWLGVCLFVCVCVDTDASRWPGRLRSNCELRRCGVDSSCGLLGVSTAVFWRPLPRCRRPNDSQCFKQTQRWLFSVAVRGGRGKVLELSQILTRFRWFSSGKRIVALAENRDLVWIKWTQANNENNGTWGRILIPEMDEKPAATRRGKDPGKRDYRLHRTRRVWQNESWGTSSWVHPYLDLPN